jgi:uncharacterized surface protein with fasciclin (FAS1) repeats
MTSLKRRALLAIGSLAAGGLAVPTMLRAQTTQATRTLADTLAGDVRFSRFLDLIVRVSATDLFKQASPITVFAPVDQAFQGAPAGLLQDLVGPIGSGNTTNDTESQRVLALIRNHMVAGAFAPQQIAGSDRRLATLNGGDIQISGEAGSMTVRNPAPGTQIGAFGAAGFQAALPAQVIGAPIRASNGVIYPVSQIIWP